MGEFACTVMYRTGRCESSRLANCNCTTRRSLGIPLYQQSLPRALQAFCKIVSSEEPGSAVHIKLELFSSVYRFLAKVDGEIPQEQVDTALKWLDSES